MEKFEELLDQMEKSADKKLNPENYSEIFEALLKAPRNFSGIFRVVQDVVNKVTEFKSEDLVLQAYQAESALRVFKNIEEIFQQDLKIELSLVCSIYQKNIVKYIRSHGPLPLRTVFKEHVFNPLLNSWVFKGFSIFDAIARHLREHTEKYFELAELLLDPEFKSYEFYNELKFLFYNGLSTSIVRFGGEEKDAREKIKYKSLDDSIHVLVNGNNQYRVQYQESSNQFELFLFDVNVFLSLNKLFSPICMNSIKTNSKLRTVSLSFDNFGCSLSYFFTTGAFKNNKIDTQQILFVIKLIAESAIELLNSKVYIKCLHPWNIYLMNNKINILPYSYFEKCLRGEPESYKVFCSKNKGSDLESRLAYSLGVIFIYFKDQNISSFEFDKQKNNVLSNCEYEVSNFVKTLLLGRSSLRDVLDLLMG